jgi:hypothetical protein
MARKASCGLFFVVLFLSTLCMAQKNEFSVSVGATVATGTKGTFCNINIFFICNPVQFGLDTSTAPSYEGTYAHQLGDFRVGTLYIELPILGIPARSVHVEGWDLLELIIQRSSLRRRFGSRCSPRVGFHHLPAQVEDLLPLGIRSVCPTPPRQVNSASERISEVRFGFLGFA